MNLGKLAPLVLVMISKLLFACLVNSSTRQPSYFVIALYLLLRPHIKKINLITIDPDFKGWEGEIISMLTTYLQCHKSSFTTDNIRFDYVKKHRCHFVTNSAYRGEFPCVEPNREEFLRLVVVRRKKKIG